VVITKGYVELSSFGVGNCGGLRYLAEPAEQRWILRGSASNPQPKTPICEVIVEPRFTSSILDDCPSKRESRVPHQFTCFFRCFRPFSRLPAPLAVSLSFQDSVSDYLVFIIMKTGSLLLWNNFQLLSADWKSKTSYFYSALELPVFDAVLKGPGSL
jgi:hypothetical protein